MPQAHDYGWVRFPDLMGGTRRYVRFDEKGNATCKTVTAMDEVKAALDHNAQARNHTTGKMMGGDMVRVASIPPAIQLKWLTEEGLDAQNPAHAERLLAKLMDPDWAHLRTGGGRLSLSQNGEIR